MAKKPPFAESQNTYMYFICYSEDSESRPTGIRFALTTTQRCISFGWPLSYWASITVAELDKKKMSAFDRRTEVSLLLGDVPGIANAGQLASFLRQQIKSAIQ